MIPLIIGISTTIINNINVLQIPSMRPKSYQTCRITGTSTEDCADFMIIDTLKKEIRVIRYGAGANNYQSGQNQFGDRGTYNLITY